MARNETYTRIKYFSRLISRRKALRYVGATVASVVLPGLAHGSEPRGGAADGSCSEIKSEGGGPFTADGSNGPDVLSSPAVFRSDIRSNLGGGSVQPGVEFVLTVTVVDISRGCAPVDGAAVYLWHCNAEGEYSAYSGIGQTDQTGESYLRGVQVTDAGGQVTFTTIYPGRYPGRATHFHARIYADDRLSTILKTTQFAFDDSINNTVYSSDSTYDDSNSARETTNTQDALFRDGFDEQLLDMTGSPAEGYTGSIMVGIDA